VRFETAAYAFEEGGFSRSVRSKNSHEVAAFNRKAYVFQNLDRPIAAFDAVNV
jgi:hypothetical protein